MLKLKGRNRKMSFSDFGMENAAKRKILDCTHSICRRHYCVNNTHGEPCAQEKFSSSRNNGERSLGKHTFKCLGSVICNGLPKQIKKSYRFIILQLRGYYIKQYNKDTLQ